jgi:hypothetical protein
MVFNNNNPDRNVKQKGTLFCFTCEYSGHFSRGWIEVCDHSSCSLVCPDCGEKIDQRTSQHPRPPAEAD